VRDAYDNPVSQERRARVRQLAEELGCTPTQVALAWLRGQEFPVIPIVGTTKPDHLRDALGATDVPLTAEQVRWLGAD
jgi:aryl-alcohol dehydrogenase-like predicted oxidoreductase